MQRSLALAPALLLGVSLLPLAALAQEVGTAGAVNPASTGTPPSRPTRVLELGSRVVHKERISTSTGGNVQLVFVDKTTMSIGPNSDIVIDEFVYDPNAGTGRMAASMAKGVLRFVGGNTSHSGGAQIKTPSATLGIRGGVATVEVRPCAPGTPASADCGTKVTSHFGILSITSASGTEIIRRPGFVVNIPSPGAAPTAPRRVTQAEVSATNKQVSSKPGQTGGKANVTQAVIARADTVSSAVSQIGTAVMAVQQQTAARQESRAQSLGLSTGPTDPTTPTQLQQLGSNVNRQVNTQVQQQNAGLTNDNGTVTPNPPDQPNPPPTTPGETSRQAFALQQANGPGFLAPGGVRLTNLSPVLGYADGGDTAQNGTRAARTLQAGLGINGTGASQNSIFFVAIGETAIGSNGAPVAAGGATGTQRPSATSLPTRFNTGLVGSGSNVQLDANNVPTSLTVQSGSISGSGVITPESATVATYPGPRQTGYTFTDTSSRTATPAGLGSNRPNYDTGPNTNFGGMVGGLVTTVNNTTNTVGQTAAITTGLFDIIFDPSNSRFGTTIYASTNAGGSDPNAFQSGQLSYGSGGYSSGTASDRGTYVDYNNFGAREARNTDAGQSYPTYVNGAQVSEHRGAFVTSNTVNAQALFPGVTFCNCEYTRWGFWSSDTNRTVNGNSLSDLVHLGTWAFGPVAEIGQIPQSGTATYDGHAIASIKSNGAEYVAAGNFQNSVNFGNRTGNVTVSGLDGRNYAGTVALGTSSNSIMGSLSSTAGSSMTLNGQFSRGTAGPAGEMLGNLSISGSNYIGSGIFAGATRGITP